MDNTATIHVLNDLIAINNDRIAGYEKAIHHLQEIKHEALRKFFEKMIEESRAYKTELEEIVTACGGNATDGTTTRGKLYRMWMDIQSLIGEGDREMVLNNCETGEDAAQKAYQMALNDDELMAETKLIISRQQKALQESHHKIKGLRDAVSK